MIVARLAYLQLYKGSQFHNRVKQLHALHNSNINRGDIVDRSGKTMAMDIDRFTLEYNPVASDRENREKLATKLSQIFKFPVSAQKLLYKNSSQTLVRNLSLNQAEEIRKLGSPSLYIRKITTRFYPQDSLMSHVLGYVDNYGRARQGLEYQYREFLRKNPEKKLTLSLDSKLQAFVEAKLTAQINKTRAIKGTAMVMKVKTGEILAWAVKPDYNPNFYYKYGYKELKNWTLVDVYQPGSVFKILTASAAIDAGVIDKDFVYQDKGYIKVGGYTISNHDWVRGKTKVKPLTIQGLFERSSNPFATFLGLKLGKQKLYDYIRMFGFGQKTNIELPGETDAIVRKPETWRDSDIASTSIGQGAIAVTPLQLIAGINAIANDGTWIKPTILRTDTESNKPLLFSTKVDVIEPELAKYIQEKLANSIQENIKKRYAKAGKVAGLRVAGKTGTSQKLIDGRYSRSNTIASFLGFYPNPNPEYITLVVIDDPKTDGRWGETIAGPVFNQIAEYMKTHYL